MTVVTQSPGTDHQGEQGKSRPAHLLVTGVSSKALDTKNIEF
jgi:hypothetical protein